MKDVGQENGISVCVNPESLHKGHNITGDIWIEFLDFQFPSNNWSDFPEIILGWWLEALFKLWSGKKAHAGCSFMDGPYSYKVTRENNRYVLRCYHDALIGEETEWEGEIDLDLLLKQVLKAASALMKECQKRGWTTPDTETLMSRLIYIDGVLNPESA